MGFDKNWDGFLSSEEIKNGLKNFIPPIPLNKIELKIIEDLMDVMSTEFVVTLKQYYDWFGVDAMFKKYILPSSPDMVSEERLMKNLELLGMTPSEKIISTNIQTGMTPGDKMANYKTVFWAGMREELLLVRKKVLFKYGLDRVPGEGGGEGGESDMDFEA